MKPATQPVVLMTGATHGLGLRTAHQLARCGAMVIVAGRHPTRTSRLASEIGGQSLLLDLADVASVEAALVELNNRPFGAVDTVIANAGVQVPGGVTKTPDGWETTVQVNFLSQLLLIDRMLAPERSPRRVVFVGSASHDPARTPLPDPWLGEMAVVAGGLFPETEPDEDQGMKRYATSKLLVTAAAMGLAREHVDKEILCFDPGSMLGTGLYRDHSLAQRTVFRLMGPLASHRPGFSTPRRSARQLAKIGMNGFRLPVNSTADFDGKISAVSSMAADPTYQSAVLSQTRELFRLQGLGRRAGSG